MKTTTIKLADGRSIQMAAEKTSVLSIRAILMAMAIGGAVIGLAIIAKAAGL